MNNCMLLLLCLFCLGGGCGKNESCSRQKRPACAEKPKCPPSGGQEKPSCEPSCPCQGARFEPRFDAMPFNGSGSTCGCEEKS